MELGISLFTKSSVFRPPTGLVCPFLPVELRAPEVNSKPRGTAAGDATEGKKTNDELVLF
jgi:hypothetical protein